MNSFGDNPSQDRGPESASVSPQQALLGYVTAKVRRARDVRDQKYGTRWAEYTRLWRGFWATEDASNNSERSRLIAPALQQSIEMAVAEIEEAVFSRSAWFDIKDDIRDENKDDAIAYRDQLLEDLELAAAPDAIAQVFLLGALYGTGIAKINVRLEDVKEMGEDGEAVESDKVLVTVEPIRPDEFVIDPAATSIDEALFCAHEFIKPRHTIEEKQEHGIYAKGDIRGYNGRRGDSTGTGSTSTVESQDDGVLITEFYGRVPARWVEGAEEDEGEDLVEAIVTVANEGLVLRAVASPYTMKDRPIVAYQHDTVPGEFWGRGVAEKGYNPQKALDSELRARIDALALMTAPMLGADMGRMPRNPDMRVRPGKVFFTRGRPSEVIEPIGFNAAGLALTFQQSGDLERMVQMGTGSMDSATPVGINSRNETMGGMSMLQTGFLKRSKRTMQNIERQFLAPLIRRATWRYMQFDPERYPKDMKFLVRASMGIMAKEVELQQLTQLLGYTPPESPAHGLIVKAIFDNTASSEKAELKKAIDAMNQPPSPEQQQMQQRMQQIQLALQEAELAAIQAKAQEAQANAQLAMAKANRELVLADLEDDKVDIAAANAAIGARKAHMAEAQTEVARERNQIEKIKVNKQTTAK